MSIALKGSVDESSLTTSDHTASHGYLYNIDDDIQRKQ